MCQVRERHVFGGLPVQERFDKLQCGVALVEIASGRVLGRLDFTAGCQELFEVKFLPGLRRPAFSGPFAGLDGSEVIWTVPEAR